jgi:D-alanyl-lipoteichoic acid acyltransferase DltB (MBOAT superfamily)
MFFIPIYVLILLFTIVIDYFAGIWIEKQQTKHRKKIFLICSLIANIGVLAFFKYYNFLNENITELLGFSGNNNPIPYLDIILPIGLSFHTFQAMSYTIEVYRGNQAAEKNFFTYALYVMFYPQLVAGPIERPQNILPQLHEKKTFDLEKLLSGLQLIVWGLLKKAVIADRFAAMADPVFNHPQGHSGWEMLMATYFFTIQIYCDFSGYSDIAIGSARVLGIDLMKNFNTPYFSVSIAEFWKRWHISLSTWFRDYLYIPLGGNRTSKIKVLRNILLVFLISGLWHGASWCFVIWGGLHAVYLIFETVTLKQRTNLWKWLRIPKGSLLYKTIAIFITFNLVAFAWIFFRAQQIPVALYMVKTIGHTLWSSLLGGIISFIATLYTQVLNHIQELGWILFAVSIFALLSEARFNFNQVSIAWKRNLYFILVLMIIILMGKSEQQQFIYFQF